MPKTPKYIEFLVITLIVLGIILQFSNLEQRPYWNDETFTSLQIYGKDYDSSEVKDQIYTKIVTAKELEKFLYPGSTSSVNGTINLIAKKEPQLSPLYFVLVRYWIKIFGNSIVTIRIFSALVGILSIFFMYCLCVELFQARKPAWIAAAFVAVSPFHLIYAQEARPYSLWALTIILSHIALLHFLRISSVFNWLIYILANVVGLYTYLFSLLVLAGHLIFVLRYENFRFTKKTISLIFAAAVSLVCFWPWLSIFISNKDKANLGNIHSILKVPFWYMLHWFRELGIVFADYNVGDSSSKLHQILYGLILIFVTVISSLAIYFICSQEKRLPRLFLMTAVIVPFIPLFLKDLFIGGGSSTAPRYLTPCWLAIEIIIAYWFSKKNYTSYFLNKICHFLLVLLLLMGIFSRLTMTNSQLWWNKAEANINKQFAYQIINQVKDPLILSDAFFPVSLSLSTMVNSHTRFLLYPENSKIKLSLTQENIFLFRPSQKMLNGIKDKYSIETVKLKNPYNPGKYSKEENFYRIKL